MLSRIIMLSVPLIFMAYTKAQSQPMLSFENQAVEQAYYDHDKTRDLIKGILFEFALDELPSDEEQRVITSVTAQAGLKQSKIMQFHDATMWVFDWPHWRFNEEGEAVCEKLKEKFYRLWQNCISNTRALVWSN